MNRPSFLFFSLLVIPLAVGYYNAVVMPKIKVEPQCEANYSSTFYCEYGKRPNFTWCLYHQYFENDLMLNDLLTTVSIVCVTNQTEISHNTTAIFSGQDGVFDLGGYESLVIVYHNCTSKPSHRTIYDPKHFLSNETLRKTYHLPDISFQQRHVSHSYSLNITDIGANRNIFSRKRWPIPKDGKLKFLGDWMSGQTIWDSHDGWYYSYEMTDEWKQKFEVHHHH